ncbi:IS3 family transposase [Paenibacillus foliorum]
MRVCKISQQYPIVKLCELLGVSRSSYYRYTNNPNTQVKERIQAIYAQRKGTSGYRKIQAGLLRQYGVLPAL